MRRLILIACLPASLSAQADGDKPTYDRIDFGVSAKAQVENDTLTAVLYALKQGPDLAALSGEVNKAIAAAVKRARQESAVTVQTLDYETFPNNYQNNRPAGWLVRQSIRLESKSPEPLAKLVGELQSGLALGSMGYAISPERFKEQEEKLIDQALAAFRGRAERIAKDLGRAQYRIVQARIERGGRPEPRPFRAMGMAAEAAPAALPPTLEAGRDTVEVQVNGTIELQPN